MPGAIVAGMIVGIGFDLVEIARMRRAVGRSGERFLDRVFTRGERSYSDSHADPASHLAARFAAKEALFKALGTGWSGGVSWREVEVSIGESGEPELSLGGRASEIFQSRGGRRAHLSLTHSETIAGAVVVLEGERPG